MYLYICMKKSRGRQREGGREGENEADTNVFCLGPLLAKRLPKVFVDWVEYIRTYLVIILWCMKSSHCGRFCMRYSALYITYTCFYRTVHIRLDIYALWAALIRTPWNEDVFTSNHLKHPLSVCTLQSLQLEHLRTYATKLRKIYVHPACVQNSQYM